MTVLFFNFQRWEIPFKVNIYFFRSTIFHQTEACEGFGRLFLLSLATATLIKHFDQKYHKIKKKRSFRWKLNSYLYIFCLIKSFAKDCKFLNKMHIDIKKAIIKWLNNAWERYPLAHCPVCSIISLPVITTLNPWFPKRTLDWTVP